MTQIQPIQIPLRNETAEFIKMRSEFDLNAETSRVFWQVFNSEQQPITSGMIEIPSEVHEAWTSDDTHIEDYVLEKLNLVRYE